MLSLLAVVPLGLVIHGASAREAMILAYGFGLFVWLFATRGLAFGLAAYVQLLPPKTLLFMTVLCAYQAVPYGIFGYWYGTRQWMETRWGAVKTAAALTILLSIFPAPLPVTLAHALYELPRAIQFLEFGGEPLLLFLLCLVNTLAVQAVLGIVYHQRVASSIVSLTAVVTAVVGYGVVRLDQYRNGAEVGSGAPVINVVSLQPNLPLPDRRSDNALWDANRTEERLIEMSLQSLSNSPYADLLVWPEVPVDIDCSVVESAFRQRLTKLRDAAQAAFLANCVQRPTTGGKYNTALFVPPKGKSTAYVKHKLFPFAEYIPFEGRVGTLRTLFPGASQYRPGTELVVFPVSETEPARQ